MNFNKKNFLLKNFNSNNEDNNNNNSIGFLQKQKSIWVTYQETVNEKLNKWFNKLNMPQLVENNEIAQALNIANKNVIHKGIPELNLENDLKAKETKTPQKQIVERNANNQHIISHHIRKELEAEYIPLHCQIKKYKMTRKQIEQNMDIEDLIEEEDVQQAEENEDNQEQPQQDYYDPEYKMQLNKKYMKEKEEELKRKVEEEKKRVYGHITDDILLDVPSRPIIDINSTRLIQSNVVDTILIPNIDSADADRNRQVLQAVENQLYEKQEWKSKLEDKYEDWDEQQIRIRTQTLQQFFKHIDEFQPRYNNDPRDTLVIATDVLYYINNEDIYKMAEKVNDGTFMLGAIHIPKELSTVEKPIIFSSQNKVFLEGKIRIIPKSMNYDQQYYDPNECTIQMAMDGNDHIYTHNIRFPELAERKFVVLNTKKDYNFIVKAVAQKRIDTGGTYYTMITLVKITDYKLEDLLDIDDCWGEKQVYATHLANARAQQEVSTISYYLNAADLKRYQVTNSDYQKFITKRKWVEGMYVTTVEPNPEHQQFLNQDATANTVQYGPSYYIIQNKGSTNSVNTDIIFKNSIRAIYEKYEVVPADNNLINKLNTRIALAPKVDATFIRALINFINREKPTIPIDAAMSLITKCLYQTMDIESQISLLKDSGVTKMINNLKLDKVQKIPTSLWESFWTGNIFKYIKIKFTGLLFGDQTTANLQKVGPFC